MSSKNKKRTVRIVSAILLLLISAAFVLLSPSYFTGRIGIDHFRIFFLPKTEPSTIIINVWHIVSFKPYIGSLGSWLNERAQEYSNNYINIYFSVRSMSYEEANEELKRGEHPDVVSFADHSTFEGMIIRNAVPFCRSGYFIVYDSNVSASSKQEELIEKAGTVSDFKKGRAVSCICDIRETGDLYRAQLIGDCPYFEAHPISFKDAPVQYIGVYAEISEEKTSYAQGFVDYVIGVKAQSLLSSIGLIPMLPDAKTDYEVDWLKELYLLYFPKEED